MSGRQRHDHDDAAPAFHFIGADDRVFRIITTLHDHIGAQNLDEIEGRILRKNYNQIDTFEPGQHIASFSVGANRTGWSLESPHGFVAIDTNDQRVSGLSRRSENIDVPGMNEVEDAVGKRDLSYLCRAPALRIDPRRDFAGRIAWPQSLLAAIGWKCKTCSLLNGSLITSS